MGVNQDDLVRLEQPGQHRRDLLAAVRWPRHSRELRHVPGIANRDTTKGLYPLGDFVHQIELLTGVLVQQQVQLVEGRPTHEPVVLFV